jgi:hypothetical protein
MFQFDPHSINKAEQKVPDIQRGDKTYLSLMSQVRMQLSRTSCESPCQNS